VIRNVTEVRERDRVCRQADELSVPIEQWRAGIWAAARRDDLQIRTFLVDPTDPDTAHSNPAAQLMYVVLAERNVDPQALIEAIDAFAAPLAQVFHDATRPPVPVTSIADRRARRSVYPCRCLVRSTIYRTLPEELRCG